MNCLRFSLHTSGFLRRLRGKRNLSKKIIMMAKNSIRMRFLKLLFIVDYLYSLGCEQLTEKGTKSAHLSVFLCEITNIYILMSNNINVFLYNNIIVFV